MPHNDNDDSDDGGGEVEKECVFVGYTGATLFRETSAADTVEISTRT